MNVVSVGKPAGIAQLVLACSQRIPAGEGVMGVSKNLGVSAELKRQRVHMREPYWPQQPYIISWRERLLAHFPQRPLFVLCSGQWPHTQQNILKEVLGGLLFKT